MTDPVCAQCGKPADAHHDFQPVSIPAGCQCDLLTWAPESPGEVCNSYLGQQGESVGEVYCKHCAHDRACHGDHDA